MPTIFCRSITSPVRASGQLLSALLSNLSICLSLWEWSGVRGSLSLPLSVRAESRYGNLCPAHAQLARLLSSLSRLVSLPIPSDEQRTRGQHRNQRGRWITSVEQECAAQTMPKPRSQRRFYGECHVCFFATCGKVEDKCPEIQETRRRRSHVKNSQEGRD